MSWNPHMEVHHYVNTSYPSNTAGSFMEYFEGLTYEHVNFIFSGASHAQRNENTPRFRTRELPPKPPLPPVELASAGFLLPESVYPYPSTSFYKFGLSEPGSGLYYDVPHAYEVHDFDLRNDAYRRPSENSSTMTNQQTAAANSEWEGNAATINTRGNPVECPRRHHSSHDYQVVWQDNIDPDNMTYEVRT
ncbi:hypothetical protein TIFTF001_001290 [Ficus carica]|uniref:Uncharacterized protein n=1 Tax=Ficus carica TaxID=3494 RepID=A0AA88CQU1_FICCA|nr:hypothetical protein TIFTF001_001290 [Ficus carica]